MMRMNDLIERLRFGGNHKSEATRHEAADRIEQLEAALREIASQNLTEDISQDDLDGTDFEGAYDHLIRIARAALAPETEK
jgi:single-stranded DNA-specific DHH superfamily exonuclease